MDQWSNKPMERRTNESIKQCITVKSMEQWLSETLHQWTNQSQNYWNHEATKQKTRSHLQNTLNTIIKHQNYTHPHLHLPTTTTKSNTHGKMQNTPPAMQLLSFPNSPPYPSHSTRPIHRTKTKLTSILDMGVSRLLPHTAKRTNILSTDIQKTETTRDSHI